MLCLFFNIKIIVWDYFRLNVDKREFRFISGKKIYFYEHLTFLFYLSFWGGIMCNDSYVRFSNITKVFGPVKANDNVSFDVKKGEIHALLGENGSGKSTLVSILSGIYTADSGQIFVNGKEVVFSSPKDAIDAGIGMVHQHFKLVEVLTAKENIVAGSKIGFFIKGKELSNKITEISEKYGLAVSPDKKIYNMSVGEKQNVEILKMLYRGAEVLILDEPTAVLTPQETKVLFSILRKMKEKGCAIIIITHKLNEVMEISDRVTVLNKGVCIGTVDTKDACIKQLTEMMVGRSINLDLERAETEITKDPMLEVKNISYNDALGFSILKNVSFDLHGGEILGVAGIAGSGQKELCEIIAGVLCAKSGEVLFKGENINGLSPRTIAKKGIGMSFIPEDRLGMGLVAGKSIVDNVMLKSYHRNKGIFVDREKGRKLAEQIVKDFDVSTPSVNHIVKKLSGGNIQKVLLGREVGLDPEILITAYPVRGLDIGASYNIYDILNREKRKGIGILFIGEDLDVLLQLSDRLMIIHDGEVMGIVDPRTTTKEQVGLMMLGKNIEEVL